MNSATLRRAEPADWEQFRRWAQAENWTLLPLEASLYFEHPDATAFALTLGGKTAGVITTLRHRHSGWIGNLLVAPEHRRQGLGEHLFEVALKNLQQRGATSVWLTASEMGRSLYERHGFVRVNRIHRWTQSGLGTAATTVTEIPLSDLVQADAAAWQDDRGTLLAMLAESGELLGCDGELVLLQDAGDVRVAGPWLSGNGPVSARQWLLRELLARTPASATLIVDVLSTSPVAALLSQAGFTYRGGNELMVLGPVDGIAFERIAALASLGSCG